MFFIVLLEVACWMITGERQAARIRGLYLKALLRQDIAFFDKEMTTGQLVESMSGDTILIQDAIGEKVDPCNCKHIIVSLCIVMLVHINFTKATKHIGSVFVSNDLNLSPVFRIKEYKLSLYANM